MRTRDVARWIPALAACVIAAPARTAPANKACDLLTASELESVLAAKVTLSGGDMAGVAVCTARTPTATVMLRLFKTTDDPSGATEKAGIEAYKQMGAQVEVKSFGATTCVAVVPPASLVQHGFGTTCTVSKPPMFAVLEVTAKKQQDAVSIEKLRPLADKMAGRF